MLGPLIAGMFIAASMTPSTPINHEPWNLGYGRSGHTNNNLWTALGEVNGDIGTTGDPGSSMEFPGGTGDNHLYRGCNWIGLISEDGETLVVANGLC